MNIVQVCQYLYPGQIEVNNISFKKPDDEILIAYWNVPDVPKPSEKELLAYGEQHKLAITVNALALDVAARIENLCNQTAKTRDYKDAVSCVSYANSSNLKWKVEADTFIAWRDSVWQYCYDELAKFQAGTRPIVTPEEFMSELPSIIWPD